MVKWISTHAGEKASVNGIIMLFVTWESDGYHVSAKGHTGGLKLKGTVEEIERAKKEAVRLGKKLLLQTLEMIGE